MGIETEKPPPIRTDLEVTPQYFRGKLSYVVKDPVSLKYYRLGEVEYIVLSCFQEGCGIEQTQHEVKRLTGEEVSAFEVYKYANQLRGSNLLKSKGMGDARRIAELRQKEKSGRFKRFISNYLFITIPMWDPDRALEKFLPVFRFFFRPFFGLLWLATALAAVWIIATNFSTLVADAFSLLSGWNLLILSGTVFAIKFFHELGHAFTCKHFGGEVHAIGPAFLVFQPAMFTETNDAWSLTEKWQRVAVTFAGLGTEIMMAGVAAMIWISSEPGFVKQVAYSTMVACSIHSVLFNANPLLRFDGYYMLMDLVEVPNLRLKASQYLEYLFDRYVLGLDADPPPLDKAPHTYVIYGVLRIIYRIFIIISISFFLYSIFEPLGIFSLLSSTYGMIIMPLYKHGKELKRNYSRGKISIKYALMVALLLGGAVSLFFIPVPYTISAPVVFQPEETSVIRAPALATVDEVLVESGERVEEGQVMARLSSESLEKRFERLKIRRQEVEARMRGALGRDQASYQMLVREKEKLGSEIDDVGEKLERLTLRSPRQGIVMEIHRAEARLGADRHAFVSLDEENSIDPAWFEGSTVRPGTGLMTVGCRGGGFFAAYVREYDLAPLAGGALLETIFRASPETIYQSRVEEIVSVDVQTIENVGITLADVGFIPVEPAPDGGKRPLVTLYQVRARPAEGQEITLPLGMTGKARIHYGSGPWAPFLFSRIVMGLRLRLQAI